MPAPRVLILRAPGANCDEETAYAFERAGAVAERVHINRVLDAPGILDGYQVLTIPGGFTYGDDVAAGKILAAQIRGRLDDAVRRFRDRDTLTLGICNGFQVLLKAGLLVEPEGPDAAPPATLSSNECGRFEDRWVHLKADPGRCIFLRNVEIIELPIAHGEGKFVGRDESALRRLRDRGQVVLRYVDDQGRPGPYPINPNGSVDDIAGIGDPTGRVFGLMPHPERHVEPTQHPQWTRRGLKAEGDGLRIFRNAVEYFRA